MLLKKTNVEHALKRAKIRASESGILAQIEHILNNHAANNKGPSVAEQQTEKRVNEFDFDQLETERIFHVEQIKEICIDYRLRFLDLKYFKGKLPKSALSRIRTLEKSHNTTLSELKIMAPSKLFKLADKDDPLLFVPIGNDYYYLIHKWGNDLHPLRKILVWPFKNLVNLTLIVFLASYLATLMLPHGLFTKSSGATEFLMVFFFMFKCLAAVVIFYGFALGKNFNPAIWNSKYFNV